MAMSIAALQELKGLSKEELTARYERLKSGLASAKKHGARVTENAVDLVLAGVGGGIAGFTQFKHPKIGAAPATSTSPARTGWDTDAVIAAVISGAVILDMAGKYDRQLLAIGQGLTGAFAARESFAFFQNRAKKTS